MSHWIMGIIAGISGLIGLLMAGAARDFGIFWFGLTLSVFGVLFGWWMIKIAYDETEALAVDPSHGQAERDGQGLQSRKVRSAV